jgi:hypothetical protein
MRRFIPIIVAALLSGSVAGFICYGVGRQQATTVNAATAISSFDTIKKLRTGQLAEAIARQEAKCFASATAVLSESGWRSEAFRKTMVSGLTEYRHAYRTNQAEWSPTEQRLERLLAQNQ